MLQNVKWCGCYIAIKGGRIHGDVRVTLFAYLDHYCKINVHASASCFPPFLPFHLFPLILFYVPLLPLSFLLLPPLPPLTFLLLPPLVPRAFLLFPPLPPLTFLLLPPLSSHPSLPSIQGKGGKFCHLRVHVLPDNYVYFESMEHPGQYVTMTSTGSVGSPVHAGPNDKNTQFFVRLEVRTRFYGIHTDFSMHGHINGNLSNIA